uniref:SFRICE_001828 n=1 Tax=Spodoptera frugiperda TaxID=7108 RepID=A0A2H1V0Y6_SPOFR
MLPYSRGLILDNTSNYGIVKTETVFGFAPTSHDGYMDGGFNATEPVQWIIANSNFAPRSLQVTDSESRAFKPQPKVEPRHKKKKGNKTHSNKKRKGKGKLKGQKCIFKVFKKSSKKRRGGNKFPKMHKKYMMPLILGLLAAKSLLIPIALKALAFLSAKGLMMGFFSTVMASVLSLKGMFDHNHSYQNRKDDTKTQVEIIQVPSKSEDHVYYDEHYKRGDYVPVPVMVH